MVSPMPAMRALKANCLGPYELLAQNIALISPTMTAALIIPVMYSNTGELELAVLCARHRHAAVRGLQPQPVRLALDRLRLDVCLYLAGLGNNAGAIGGWSLIWAYLGHFHRRASPASPSSPASCWR